MPWIGQSHSSLISSDTDVILISSARHWISDDLCHKIEISTKIKETWYSVVLYSEYQAEMVTHLYKKIKYGLIFAIYVLFATMLHCYIATNLEKSAFRKKITSCYIATLLQSIGETGIDKI